MYKNPYKGKFIVIEGLDGAGSSTQASRLTEYLSDKNMRISLTKEPTDNLIGGLVRSQLGGDWKSGAVCLQLLFTADRAYHLKKRIIPLLKKGVNIVTDRYFFSTIAYGNLGVKDWNWLLKINEKFMLPDMTFILKVSSKICAERMRISRFHKELFEKEEKLKKVWKNYERLAKEFENVFVIDGERAVEIVSYDIINKAKLILNKANN